MPKHQSITEYDDDDNDRHLWRAVIAQAVRDATMGETLNVNATTEWNDIKEAVHWLLLDNDDFPYVCSLAGVHPDRVRQNVRATLRKQQRVHERRAVELFPRRCPPPAPPRRGVRQDISARTIVYRHAKTANYIRSALGA